MRSGFVMPKKVVPVRVLARIVERHHTNVFRDLKRRGYTLDRRRSPSGQWLSVLTKEDADRYIAERQREAL
jgi:hypothetical protein